MKKVKTAAIKKSDGTTITEPRPNRHKDVAAADKKRGGAGKGKRGFILSDGSFSGRQKSKEVAKEAGQIKKKPKKRGLHSEDIF